MKSAPADLGASPEVAVIIPCYNIKGCVERALRSVFAQTYRNFRVYAVDDASTDGTGRVLEQYADRCTYLSKPHGGLASARNHGVRASQSPLIAFLDGDDEWLPSMLEHQVAFFTRFPDVGFVCTNWMESYGGQDPGTPMLFSPANGYVFERLVRNCFVLPSTVVARRECLEQMGPFDESLTVSEDYNMWLRIATGWKVALLPEVLAIRHRRPESLSLSTPSEVIYRSGVAALENVKFSCRGLTPSQTRALRDTLAERHYCRGSGLLAGGAKAEARRKFVTVLRLAPGHWRASAKLILSILPARVLQLFTTLRQKWRSPARTI